ncbi:MAG: threonyl-tRNA synthetase, partial [Actinomycetota bacterium]
MTTNISTITIRLPDDSTRELPSGSTGFDLAMSIGKRLGQAAVATVVNGIETDLGVSLVDGAKVSIITADSDAGRHVLRHSTAHVLAQAVVQLFKGAKFSIGPAIEDGFYYDFELPNSTTFSDDDLGKIQQRMQEIVSADQPFIRSEMSARDALKLFSDQPYKCEIIERVTQGDADSSDAGEAGSADAVSVYRNTDDFVDLCRGPHVSSTSRLGHFALMKVAGAYWRGNEKGPMLQRIYGTAWESK